MNTHTTAASMILLTAGRTKETKRLSLSTSEMLSSLNKHERATQKLINNAYNSRIAMPAIKRELGNGHVPMRLNSLSLSSSQGLQTSMTLH